MSDPDVLVVQAEHEEDVYADGAELHVEVRGSSLVTGRAALKRAREVQALVGELAGVGIAEHKIQLAGVEAHVSSGLLGKSSSATYRLKVIVDDLDGLADVLGVVTSQKTTQLEQLEWRYPEEGPLQLGWLERCLGSAQKKAEVAAAALRVQLVGVHRVREQALREGHARAPWDDEGGGKMMSRAPGARPRVSKEELSLEVSHARKMGLRVEVQFRISGPSAG
jgi:uncharacterized protein YggE